MSILNRLLDWAYLRDHPTVKGMDQRSVIAATYPSYVIGKPVWPERDAFSYQQDAYRKISLIFRCVGLIANSVASAPIRVYNEDAKGKQTTIPDHPMRQLMRRPNPGMRETRFMAFVAMVMAVSGFCVVEKVRSQAGRVVELYPLRSDWLRPVPREQAPPDWEYRVPGYTQPFTLPSSDVIVFPYADRPDANATGMGPLEAALREYGLVNTMTDFVKAFFDSGAMPVYALVPRQSDNGLGSNRRMTQAEADYVKAKWVSRYGGLNRAIEPAILDGIEDVKKLSFDFNELAYTDLRDLSEAAICQAFGVSPMLVDAMVGMKHSTYSNKSEARQGFYEDTIVPLWARMDDILTLGLLSEFETRQTVSLEFDTSKIAALQEDRNAKASWVVQATLGGAMTVHTMHRELSLPLPMGDDFYLRGLAQSAEPVGVKPEKATDATGDAGRSAFPLGWTIIENPNVPPNTLVAVVDGEVRAITRLAGPKPSAMHRLPPEQRAKIGAVNRKTFLAIAKARKPSIAAYFDGLGERVLTSVALGSERRVTLPIDWDAEEKKLAEILRKLYDACGVAAWSAISDHIGVAIVWDVTNKHVRKVLDYLAKSVRGITDESRSKIADVIAKGAEDEATIDDIKDRLTTVFAGWSDSRAETIAHTESMTGYNLASVAGYKETGVVDRAQMFDNPVHTESYDASDGLTCAERDGLIVPIDDVIRHVAAEHPRGSLVISPVLEKALGEE